MAIQILINDVDYTKYVDLQSVKVDSNIAVSSDNCMMDIIISNQEIARPKGGQEIKILNGSILEFAGCILTPKETALAADVMKYQVQSRDYIFYFDKYVVTNTYTNMTAGDIVKDIVKNFTTGFTSNNVHGTDSSLNFPQIKFDHQSPSSVIKQLANDVGFQWRVDYNKDVHFGNITLYPSKLPGNLLDVDNDTVNYGNLEITEDVSQIRNQVYLYGYKIPADYTLTFTATGDGQTKTFYTPYEPKHDLASITVNVGGTVQTNKLDISGGEPNANVQDNTCYIYYTNKSYRFNVAPAKGTTVTITYYPMFEQVNLYNDPSAMSVMKQRDRMDGVYEYGLRDKKLTSIDSSLADIEGQYQLDKYAYPHLSGQFNSYLQGWQPGQYFNMTSNVRMDGEIQDQTFYVTKVSKNIVSHPKDGTPTFYYTITFSDTAYQF